MLARIGSAVALIALQAMIYFTSGPYALLTSLSICSCFAVMTYARGARKTKIRTASMYSAAVAVLIVLTAWTVYSFRAQTAGGASLLMALSMGFTPQVMGYRFLFFGLDAESSKDRADVARRESV